MMSLLAVPLILGLLLSPEEPTTAPADTQPALPTLVLMPLEELPSSCQPAISPTPGSGPVLTPYQLAARACYRQLHEQGEPILSEIFLMGDEERVEDLAALAEELLAGLDEAEASLPADDPYPMTTHLENWRLLFEGMRLIARSSEPRGVRAELAEKLADESRWSTDRMRELALLLAARLERQAGQPAQSIKRIGTLGPEEQNWRPARLALQMEELRALGDQDDLPLALLLAGRLEQTCLAWKPRSLRTPALNAVWWLRQDLTRQWAEHLERVGEVQAAGERRNQMADWLRQRPADESLSVLRFGRLFSPPSWLTPELATSGPTDRAEGEDEEVDAVGESDPD
jgi:hypothetical protein